MPGALEIVIWVCRHPHSIVGLVAAASRVGVGPSIPPHQVSTGVTECVRHVRKPMFCTLQDM